MISTYHFSSVDDSQLAVTGKSFRCMHVNIYEVDDYLLLTLSSGASKKTADQPNSIDDFVPEEMIDSAFLDETDKGGDKKIAAANSENDSSDDSDR